MQTHGIVAPTADLQFSLHHGAQCDCWALLQRYFPVPSISLGTLRLHVQRTGSYQPGVFQRSGQTRGSPERTAKTVILRKVCRQVLCAYVFCGDCIRKCESRPSGWLTYPGIFLSRSCRYSSFEDDQVPKFMYGTHYSSAGVVLHYLVRQEPFTSLHVNLQVGAEKTIISIRDLKR